MAPKRRGGGDGGDNRGGKRQAKNWAPPGQSKGPLIPAKSTGFLVSCVGGKEYLASREAIELLSQYIEGDSGPSGQPAAAAASDISALIAEEVEDLKTKKNQPLHWHKTNINGLLYIALGESAAGVSPSKVVHAMATDIKATQQCRSRLCLRFIPVEYVCHASLEDIKKLAERVVPVAFPARPDDAETETFAVLYEHRASPSLDRMTIINAFVDLMPKGYKVALDNAKHTIIVQLVKSSGAVAVVQDYKDLMKFNIRELSGAGDSKEHREAAQQKAASVPKADAPVAAVAAAEQPVATASGEAPAAVATGEAVTASSPAQATKGAPIVPETAAEPGSEPAVVSAEEESNAPPAAEGGG